jgi:hypothetical protein
LLPEHAGAVLGSSAGEILETMFFLMPEPCEPPAAWEPHSQGASVEFRGDYGGHFEVHLDEQLGNEMAAGFLGCFDPTEVTPEHSAQVVCEFANMVCGVTLTRMTPGGTFNLAAPKPCSEPSGMDRKPGQIVRWLDTGSGLIRLSLSPDA